MNAFERAAFERLLRIATDRGHWPKPDCGELHPRLVDAGSLGGFDLADLFLLDHAISLDIATIVVCLARNSEAFYPTEYLSDAEAVIA